MNSAPKLTSTQVLKPFRFITPLELQGLKEYFALTLTRWNEEYALFALNHELELTVNSTRPPSTLTTLHAITKDEVQLALIEEQSLATLCYSLFGEIKPAFDSIGHSLLLTLLNQLLDKPNLESAPLQTQEHKKTSFKPEEWFYTGAPSITMILSNQHNAFRLYLHPQWVLDYLPKRSFTKQETIAINDVLSPQALLCQVELQSLTLPLQELKHLCVGDVVVTDHPIQSALHLCLNEKTLCKVKLGKHKSYKSIQIASNDEY